VTALRAFAYLIVLCLVLASAGSAVAARRASEVSVYVAPFEHVGPEGTAMPDIAVLLADRLGTRGLGKVVGPAAMRVDTSAEPSVEQVQTWAGKADTEFVVVGRSTQIGRRVSLDLRVRSAVDGSTVGTYVTEAGRPDELGSAVDRLATAIVAGTIAGPRSGESSPVLEEAAATPDVAAAAPAAATEVDDEGSTSEPAPQAGSAAPTGAASGGGGGRRQPLSVHSDEMEAVDGGDGTRRFLFRRNVRLRQGDMSVRSARMEAFYPAGSSDPTTMVATGGVRLTQKGRRAKCTKATFYPAGQRVVCEGDPAELQQGGDEVRGKEIEFFLENERMIVRGGADVLLEPAPAPAPVPAPAPAPAPAADGTAAEEASP
jgi:lipopolysaccharide transport protein LptA